MDKIKIVTWNIRYRYYGDGINSFVHRAGAIYDKIKEVKPDIIAFQEITAPSFKFLTETMPEYTFYGQLRQPDFSGEGVFTAVRKERLDVVEYDTFWLSPTPYVPGSKFEIQGEWPRTCVMTQIRHKDTNMRFRVFNLHLDDIFDEGRRAGIKCALSYITEINDKAKLPVLLAGDLNSTPDSDVVELCRNYNDLRDITDAIETTYHDFGRMSENCKIDYIFMSEDIAKNVRNTGAWTDNTDGIYLSDHYPIYAELVIDKHV